LKGTRGGKPQGPRKGKKVLKRTVHARIEKLKGRKRNVDPFVPRWKEGRVGRDPPEPKEGGNVVVHLPGGEQSGLKVRGEKNFTIFATTGGKRRKGGSSFLAPKREEGPGPLFGEARGGKKTG